MLPPASPQLLWREFLVQNTLLSVLVYSHVIRRVAVDAERAVCSWRRWSVK